MKSHKMRKHPGLYQQEAGEAPRMLSCALCGQGGSHKPQLSTLSTTTSLHRRDLAMHSMPATPVVSPLTNHSDEDVMDMAMEINFDGAQDPKVGKAKSKAALGEVPETFTQDFVKTFFGATPTMKPPPMATVALSQGYRDALAEALPESFRPPQHPGDSSVREALEPGQPQERYQPGIGKAQEP